MREKMVRSDVFFLVWLTIYSFQRSARSSLTDVTSDRFGQSRGIIAAFGDFNADKNTDIFTITNGTVVKVLLTTIEDEPFKEIVLLQSSDISNIVPADFDGDTQMDLLITCKVAALSFQVQIYWGLLTTDSLEPEPLTIPGNLDDQPLLLDVNGDLIPDLLGEQDGIAYFWIFSQDGRGNYTKQPVLKPPQKLNLFRPQASAFVDMDGDLAADIMLATDSGLEVWYNLKGDFHKNKVYYYPEKMEARGQATYLDVDGNGKMDVLIPSCGEESCTIWVLSQLKWYILPVSFESEPGTVWGFVTADRNPPGLGELPFTLRAGDYNLDGYPDLLAILQHTTEKGEMFQRAYILQNVGCSGPSCTGFTRTYNVAWTTQLHSPKERAVLAAFFDYQENGILDIIMTTYTSDKDFRIHLMKHTFEEDACFMKVMVTSGVCSDNCPGYRKPYGINQPGPAVSYSTLDSNGDPQVGSATQLTQSQYFALQQPYILFGLGQTPNFVDKLHVGIPHPNGTDVKTKSWSSVIPNSQLVIIPYPHDMPSKWTNKLFVTPSKLVLLTGAALLGTCGFLAGIVGILHWREKVEDKKEKLQEAHKFHFDAM